MQKAEKSIVQAREGVPMYWFLCGNKRSGGKSRRELVVVCTLKEKAREKNKFYKKGQPL